MLAATKTATTQTSFRQCVTANCCSFAVFFQVFLFSYMKNLLETNTNLLLSGKSLLHKIKLGLLFGKSRNGCLKAWRKIIIAHLSFNGQQY